MVQEQCSAHGDTRDRLCQYEDRLDKVHSRINKVIEAGSEQFRDITATMSAQGENLRLLSEVSKEIKETVSSMNDNMNKKFDEMYDYIDKKFDGLDSKVSADISKVDVKVENIRRKPGDLLWVLLLAFLGGGVTILASHLFGK